MSTTYRYICNEILDDLRQEKPDSTVTYEKVMFWVVTIANRTRYQHLLKTKTGAYLDVYDNVPVETEIASANPNLIKNRQFVVLPKAIYDIVYEQGVSYICRSQRSNCPPEFEFNLFQPTSPSKAKRLTYSPYEIPSLKNPYFYRVHNRLYFLGTETVSIDVVEMGIYSAIDTHTNLFGYDDELDLNEEQISIIRYEVLNLGRWMLANLKDRIVDADDTTSVQPKAQPVTQPQQAE